MSIRCSRGRGRAFASRPLSMILAAGAAVSAAALAGQASAQYVWTGGSTGNFNDATKWLSPPGVPVSGASTTLSFRPGNNVAAITATQNIGTPFQVNGMTFGAMSMPNAMTINGTAGNAFQLVGPSATYTLQGSGNTTFSATGATTQLATNLTFAGSGMGNVVFSGAISETGGSRSITIANSGPTHASGLVTLSVASSFTGGVTLDGGNMALGGFTGAGMGTGPFTVTANGGVLAPVSSSIVPTVPSMTLNGQLRLLPVSVGLTVGATNLLQGGGPLLINGATINGLLLNSNSSGYTGSVTCDRFDLPQMTSSASGVQLGGAAGALQGVGTYNIRAGNTLWANNASSGAPANNDRIANSATINLSSGILQVGGTGTSSSAQSNVTEVVGTVNGAGFSTLTAITNTGSTRSSVVNVNSSLSRADRGTFLFRGANLGGGAGSLVPNATLNGDGSQNFDGTAATGYIVLPAATGAGLVGGGGAAATSTISILPYAVGDAATNNAGAGTTWVTLDAIAGSASLSVRPLATAEYAADLVSGATTNARVTAATANNGTETVNSLIIASNGVVDGSVTGTGTLNVTSGAIMASTTNASGGTSISNAIAFGAAEGQIFTPGFGGLTISGNMTGTGGLTKSGGGTTNNTLFLTGDNTGLTGQLTVNSGSINFNSASALPGTGTIVTNGTSVSTSGAGINLLYSGATPLNLTRDIAANSGWTTVKALDAGAAGTVTLAGQISGNGAVSLQANGGSDIWIPHTSNTYTGPTSISSSGGKIHIAGDESLGNGGALNLAGTLVLEGDWTTARHINNGGMTIDTNGHDATLNGPMTNFTGGSITAQFNNAALNKTGAGTITITSNANALGGPINVNGGTMLINGTIAGSATNAVSVASGAVLGGSGTIYRNISVASGGTLSPGNSPGVLTQYGNLTLQSGSAFLAELNGPTAGNGAGDYDRMVVNGTVTLTDSTLATSLGFAPSFFDVFFVLTNDGTEAINGVFGGLSEGATVNLGTWAGNPYTATISYLGDSATGNTSGGNDVVLYNIIPTPGAAGLLALGGLAAIRRRRR